MSDEKKAIIKKVASDLGRLPEKKQMYVLGYMNALMDFDLGGDGKKGDNKKAHDLYKEERRI